MQNLICCIEIRIPATQVDGGTVFHRNNVNKYKTSGSRADLLEKKVENRQFNHILRCGCTKM